MSRNLMVLHILERSFHFLQLVFHVLLSNSESNYVENWVFYKQFLKLRDSTTATSKISIKFNLCPFRMIFDDSGSSFNCLKLSSSVFSQIMSQTFIKSLKYTQILFSELKSESVYVLFNSQFVINPFLMILTFLERVFRPLQLLCFEFFQKISSKGSKS